MLKWFRDKLKKWKLKNWDAQNIPEKVETLRKTVYELACLSQQLAKNVEIQLTQLIDLMRKMEGDYDDNWWRESSD